MLDVRELYQEMIIDHNRNPRNHYIMEYPSAEAKGYNPLCGDKLTVYLKIDENHVIQQVSFLGSGCAISQASASMMTESVMGKTVPEAQVIFEKFHHLMTSDDISPSIGEDKLAVLAGVRTFPARVKCATLAWHTLEAALKQDSSAVSTE